MTNDSVSKICEFWQQGSHEPTRFNGEDLRSRMNKFERTIRRRNLREYVAAGLVIGVFAYYDWVFPTLLLRIGCGLLVGHGVSSLAPGSRHDPESDATSV